MSFAGLVTFDDRPLDGRVEQQVAAAAAGPRRERVTCARTQHGLIGQRVPATPLHDDRAALFAADARPGTQARSTEHIYQAVARHGDQGLASCDGAFAFALWQPDRKRLMLGRDCLGQRALFYHRGDGFIAFATSLGGLLALPMVPRQLDEMALAQFLAVNLAARQQTFYRGIARVPARCVVELGPVTTETRSYWSPAVDTAPRRDDDYLEEARTLFDEAVASTITDVPRVAISLSGGLDSSAIAATVARQRGGETISCYSMVPPAGTTLDVGPRHYLDERDKLAALGARYPALELHLLPADAAPFRDPVRHFAYAHAPVLGPTVLGTRGALHDAMAATGCGTLLVGNFGNPGLTWKGAFSLRALLREGRFKTFAHDLSAIARLNGVSRGKVLLSDVLLPGAPQWARRIGHRLRGRDPDDASWYSALNPAFIADHDLARLWRHEGFEPWPVATGWDARRFRTHLLFDANQIGRDLRASYADAYGFDIRDPFADRRLLEFALNVPERLYRRDGVPRSFARAVFADRLPQEILSERRRGVVAPTWFRQLDARRADIAAEVEGLETSPLARRLIDIARLKRLVLQWPDSEQAAQAVRGDYRAALTRGLHVGRFIRWVEGGNA